MNQEIQEPFVQVEQMREICNCALPAKRSQEVGSVSKEGGIELEQEVLVSRVMQKRVYTALEALCPRETPLSLILLHVVQLEQSCVVRDNMLEYAQGRYHAPASVLETVLVNVRRVMRNSEHVLVQKGVGAAIILPEVGQWDALAILERIYNSVSLLQAETVVPPLMYETVISMGVGTWGEWGEPGALESLLHRAGRVARCFNLRPVIAAQSREVWPAGVSSRSQRSKARGQKARFEGIPFMELPAELPVRLQQLIPYHIAAQLRCVVVGRGQGRLTVAMVDPLQHESIGRLQQLTGLRIFPVSCNEEELSSLLAKPW